MTQEKREREESEKRRRGEERRGEERERYMKLCINCGITKINRYARMP